MILIDNVIVSDEVIREYFCCHLNDCHGRCCLSGKGGAPLAASAGEFVRTILAPVPLAAACPALT